MRNKLPRRRSQWRGRALLFGLVACVAQPLAALSDAEAQQLGYRIAAIQEAIEDPLASGALQAVTELGHDQRYYVMVRGWLGYRLQADRSLMAVNPEQPGLRERVEFLERAIRAIDLE